MSFIQNTSTTPSLQTDIWERGRLQSNRLEVPLEPPDFCAFKPKEIVGHLGNQLPAEITPYAYTVTKLDMKIISKLHEKLQSRFRSPL